MSLSDLQPSVDRFPTLKAILWCVHPLTTLVLMEFLTRHIDDDDQGEGRMIPVMQRAE